MVAGAQLRWIKASSIAFNQDVWGSCAVHLNYSRIGIVCNFSGRLG